MAIRETLRDIRDAEITAQKKTEKKRQFENLIYKTIKKEFDTSTDTVSGVYMEMIRRKNDFIYNLTPPGLTLYEASKIYNKILNELYKENKIDMLPKNETSNAEEAEEVEPIKPINWGGIFKGFLIILFFPIFLALGFGMTYKPNKKRK